MNKKVIEEGFGKINKFLANTGWYMVRSMDDGHKYLFVNSSYPLRLVEVTIFESGERNWEGKVSMHAPYLDMYGVPFSLMGRTIHSYPFDRFLTEEDVMKLFVDPEESWKKEY